ncbi:hypothetical protein [Streptomyces bohaiensis]|uniref:Uncharacterized protein n=1 Tax=Streptomyces bohaiensis TaxID=1431344 RepID=A0ABX1C4S7_9ACTN|nr:hypothetical protein [Streptomyces bohaiensis]NJQ14221.1 hypothetical protein [Streptomyces bohaiensis]
MTEGPVHKMITIDGVRVRPEDEARYRARRGLPRRRQAPPVTAAEADPAPAKRTRKPPTAPKE